MSDKSIPAFPGGGNGDLGMSLRDYFAAKAMQAEMITTFSDATAESAVDFIKAASKMDHTVTEHLAYNAHVIADAMLAERAK